MTPTPTGMMVTNIELICGHHNREQRQRIEREAWSNLVISTDKPVDLAPNWSHIVRVIAKALDSAEPAAAPTTPEPDGLDRKIELIEMRANGFQEQINHHRQLIDAHDAALAEVRDEMQALRSEYSMHVMVPLDEYDRLAAVDPFAPTPPNAASDVTKDRAHWFDRGYRAGARLAHDQPGEQP